MSQTYDVVICGAGSIGVAAAYYLAKQQKITNVLLVDLHHPLSQTSSKSGENYRNWWPQPVMVDFVNRSLDLMEELARESDNEINLTRRGYAYITANPEAEQVVHQTVNEYQQLDVGDIRWHRGDEAESYAPFVDDFENQPSGADVLMNQSLIRRIFPHFAENIQAVIHVRRAGAVSAQQLGMYMLKEAKKLGVLELRGEVTGVEQDAQGVSQVIVQTNEGEVVIKTRTLINAAGPFAPKIAAMLGLEIPVVSVLQQKFAIQDPLNVVPREMPFTIFTDSQYLTWSDDERTMLADEPQYRWLLDKFPGGLHVKPEGGYDSTWLKMGWALNHTSEEPIWKPKRMPEFVDLVLRGASTFIPGLAQYIDNVTKPVPNYGGYYTKTKENLPLVGPLAVPGAYVAGAFSGYGTMTCCAGGELIAAWVAGATLPSYGKHFSLARYDDPAYVAALDKLDEGEL